jgi:cell wall-associated NlpC family hydrolase
MRRGAFQSKLRLLCCALLLVLAACSSAPSKRPSAESARQYLYLPAASGAEAVVFALGLLDTGYRFGGTNPEAGLDCSGMISYVYEQTAQVRLPHSAAQIADTTRPITRERMRPGDLVFFNTQNRPFSHVGLYIGDGRFIHAPSSRGRVRVEQLDSTYFSNRFNGARTLLQ